jgi:hypothetical protein
MRPTARYAYPGGIRLGTAFAISGAAASPNMGYHSSTALGFLMTMFNVRLGWWMGNPRHEATWLQASPTFGLSALLRELTGNTTNSSRFVNLTDGGHFDNLGIYELVRRRCRFIVACDAEQDGKLVFSGLGSAIRKCRTDFGVEIDIDPEPIRIRDEERRHSGSHVALGDIVYPGGERGLLCYMKASITGREPADVLEYALRAKQFPHETTADQFFDESQFESYRELGHHIAHGLLAAPARDAAATRDDAYWRALFASLVARQRAERERAPGRAASAAAAERGAAVAAWNGVDRRSGNDRRRGPDRHTGPERRSGGDRRSSTPPAA